VFRGCIPAARSFAHLRIAEVVTHQVARLASGLLGSALAGQDSHLLDDRPNFQKVAPPSFPSDQPAWSLLILAVPLCMIRTLVVGQTDLPSVMLCRLTEGSICCLFLELLNFDGLPGIALPLSHIPGLWTPGR
jgi:hypothetical protein